ncbi:hypothetical protein NR798_07710 [Archangium gephyra]|uniref:hypothetical protein n=1 Tax=Archangium gephyra TaxID=48 RepID=UPI0035D3FE4B
MAVESHAAPPDSFRRFHLAASCAFMAAGLFVLFYRGPFMRFHGQRAGNLL